MFEFWSTCLHDGRSFPFWENHQLCLLWCINAPVWGMDVNVVLFCCGVVVKVWRSLRIWEEACSLSHQVCAWCFQFLEKDYFVIRMNIYPSKNDTSLSIPFSTWKPTFFCPCFTSDPFLLWSKGPSVPSFGVFLVYLTFFLQITASGLIINSLIQSFISKSKSHHFHTSVTCKVLISDIQRFNDVCSKRLLSFSRFCLMSLLSRCLTMKQDLNKCQCDSYLSLRLWGADHYEKPEICKKVTLKWTVITYKNWFMIKRLLGKYKEHT